MHSAYLLVIDSSPDHAQVINSFLRNSGVAVRVVSASGLDELEAVLNEKTPFLILIGTGLAGIHENQPDSADSRSTFNTGGHAG